MTNLQVVAEALKSFYLPGLRYQLNDQSSAFLAQLERDSENVSGKEIVMALRYGRVGGIGNRADDGTLPTPNSRKTKQAKWETKNLFARFQITDKTIQASKSNQGAFASMLEQEIADCETDAKVDLSRQAMGDGTGSLCKITDITDAATNQYVVDNAQFLAEGMLVDTYTTTTKDNEEVEIAAVDRSTNTITMVATTALAVDDVLYVSGNKDMELTGVEAVFNSTTLYGIDRTSYPFLNATKTGSVGELSEVTMQEGIDNADILAGAAINFILCSHGVRRGYQNLLTAQKQLVNTLDLKGGWKALSYNGIPVVADKFVKSGNMYMLDLADWKLYQMSDYNWLDADGAMLSRVANKPAFEATLVKYCDIGCQKPKGQVGLSGITEH